MCQRSAHCKLCFIQGVIAGFPELPFLFFEASADEETIEDLVQPGVVIWLSMVKVAVNVDVPAVMGFVGIGWIGGDGPGLTISLLLTLVAESLVEEIDDTAEWLEQDGKP